MLGLNRIGVIVLLVESSHTHSDIVSTEVEHL